VWREETVTRRPALIARSFFFKLIPAVRVRHGQGLVGGEKATASLIRLFAYSPVRSGVLGSKSPTTWIGSIPELLFDGKYIDDSLRI
jgi:hypothetical protein